MASVPTQASLPVKFHPPKSFRLPKRKFEKKTEIISSGMVWGVRTIIIHGSATTSVPIRPSITFVCQQHMKVSTKKDPAFLTKGFTFWKEATTSGDHRFQELEKHEARLQCHI